MQIAGGNWGAVCGPITDLDASAICRGLGWWYGGRVVNETRYQRPAGMLTVAGKLSCNATASGFAACSYATDANATTCNSTQVRHGALAGQGRAGSPGVL